MIGKTEIDAMCWELESGNGKVYNPPELDLTDFLLSVFEDLLNKDNLENS
jgi:hypothetical protein